MPAADRLGGGLRPLEAEPAQGRQRLGVVDDAGEDEAARLDVELRRVLEQPRVVALDPLQMAGQLAGKAIEPRVAAELGEARQRRGLERQALRLFVGDHLQPVFEPAQEDVGGGEIGDRLGGNPLLGMELPEHVERARAAHRRAAAAEDELLGLDEELDLADAAAAELEVVAGHGDQFVTARGVDLPLHRMDVGDRRVVEIFAPDERRELGEEARAEVEIAGGGPRLDHRRAFPVLAERLVVGDRAGDRQRHRRRRRIGPEAKIDAEDVTV